MKSFHKAHLKKIQLFYHRFMKGNKFQNFHVKMIGNEHGFSRVLLLSSQGVIFHKLIVMTPRFCKFHFYLFLIFSNERESPSRM